MTPPRFAFLDHPGPIAFAHRGGGKDNPENTMKAFGAAVELGYRYLETDAQATRDGVLLAFHDNTLDRLTDRTGRIDQLPYDEVKRARVGGTEEIPLMSDVLEAFPDCRVNLDAKTAASVEPLIDLVRRTGAIDRVCVGSFERSSLQRISKELGPRLCTVASPAQVARMRFASWLPVPGVVRLIAGRTAPCHQVPVRQGRIPVTDRRYVRTATRLGVSVQVWTVDDAAEMEQLLDLGVHGLMTDRLQVLKDVLVRRGQWV